MKGCLSLQDNTKYRRRALILSDKYRLSLNVSLHVILTYGIQATSNKRCGVVAASDKRYLRDKIRFLYNCVFASRGKYRLDIPVF
jgi:hypothetical protein